MSREDIRSRVAVKTELSIVNMINATGNYSQAIEILDSTTYQALLEGYGEEVQSILDYVIKLKKENGDMDIVGENQ